MLNLGLIPKRWFSRRARETERCEICTKVLLASIVSLLLIETIVLVPSYRNYVNRLCADVIKNGQVALRQIQFGLDLSNMNALEPDFFNAISAADGVNGFAFFSTSGELIRSFGTTPAGLELLKSLAPGTQCCERDSIAVSQDEFDTLIGANMMLREQPIQILLALDSAHVAVESRAYLIRVLGLVALICLGVTGSIVLVMGRYATRLKHEASHDRLTGLANRARLTHLIKHKIEANEAFHLVLFDLNGYQSVKVRWGLEYAHQLITHVADVVLQCARSNWILSRFRDDVFAVLISDSLDEAALAHELQRLRQAIATPIILENDSLTATACYGIYSHAVDSQESSTDVLDGARLSLAKAKLEGADHSQHFENKFREERDQRISVITRLRSAMAEDQLLLHYQPQYYVKTQEMAGAETLMRWRQPNQEFISPGIFIPLAEQTGIIVEYGAWALQQAVQQYASWRDAGITLPRISVNLSPRQFSDENLVDAVSRLVKDYAIEEHVLELEITESAVISSPTVALEKMNQLQALGVDFAIDDFGTGHSSLSNLGSFPFSRLKIDQSFIRNLDSIKSNQCIVRSCIELAHDLGMDVVAEGVEYKSELNLLAQWNCDVIQGYYFSKPLAPDILEELILTTTAEFQLQNAASRRKSA